MSGFTGWLEHGSASTWALAAVAIAILLSPFVHHDDRLRLRTVVVFVGLHFAAEVASLMLPSGSPARVDLVVVAHAFSVLAVTRVAFVALVDVTVVRLGGAQINQLLRDLLQVATYLVVLGGAAAATGVQWSSFVAPGALVTAVLGLAMQDTLGNLAAGVSIQLERPMAPGDWIHLDKGDVTGRVVQANWRAVSVRSDDNALLVIPNGLFAKTPFVNHSRPGGPTRRSLYFVVPYDVPPAHAHEALLAACKDSPYVVDAPAASVLTWTYAERGVTYWLRFFVADFADRDRAQGDVGTRVWYHLHRAKIASAVNVEHVYVHRRDEDAKARAEAEILADRRAAIEGVDFLRVLPEAAKDVLAREGHRQLFAPGETVLRQGATDRVFYVVRRGRLVVRAGGHELSHLGPGDFLGELALLTGSARTADVVAEAESELFAIDEVMFQQVLDLQPQLAETIARVVAERQAVNAAAKDGAERLSTHEVATSVSELLARVKELFSLGA